MNKSSVFQGRFVITGRPFVVFGDGRKKVDAPLLADTAELEQEREKLQVEHDSIFNRMHDYVEDNKREIRDQEEYNRHYVAMDEELRKSEAQLNQMKDKILEQNSRKEKIRRFFDELRQMNHLVTKFDENLWHVTIELVTVQMDKTLTFTFRDGTEISVKAADKK